MGNPHLQAKINELVLNYSPKALAEMAAEKDVRIVALEDAISCAIECLMEMPASLETVTALAVLGEALGGVSDGEN